MSVVSESALGLLKQTPGSITALCLTRVGFLSQILWGLLFLALVLWPEEPSVGSPVWGWDPSLLRGYLHIQDIPLHSFFSVFSPEDTLSLLSEKEKGREEEGERNIDTREKYHIPDQGLNPKPFNYRTLLQPTEPHWSGHSPFLTTTCGCGVSHVLISVYPTNLEVASYIVSYKTSVLPVFRWLSKVGVLSFSCNFNVGMGASKHSIYPLCHLDQKSLSMCF